jgi:hypothetical protein
MVLVDFGVAHTQNDEEDQQPTFIDDYVKCLDTLYAEYADWSGVKGVPENVQEWADARDRGTVQQTLELRRALRHVALKAGALPVASYVRPASASFWNLFKGEVDTYSRALANTNLKNDHITTDQLCFMRLKDTYLYQGWKLMAIVSANAWVQSAAFHDWGQFRKHLTTVGMTTRIFHWKFALGLAAALDPQVPRPIARKKYEDRKELLDYYITVHGSAERCEGNQHLQVKGSKGHCIFCAGYTAEAKPDLKNGRPQTDETGQPVTKQMAIWYGGQPSYKCGACEVSLCIRPPRQGEQSCFHIWHNTPDGAEFTALRQQRQQERKLDAETHRSAKLLAAVGVPDVNDDEVEPVPKKKTKSKRSSKAHPSSEQKAKNGHKIGVNKPKRPRSFGSGLKT